MPGETRRPIPAPTPPVAAERGTGRRARPLSDRAQGIVGGHGGRGHGRRDVSREAGRQAAPALLAAAARGEDHERFDRWIATFLSGGRGADPD